MKGQGILFSSNKHEWQTPRSLFEELKKEFQFVLDACTSEDNPLDTTYFYTKMQDGLEQDWITWTFCNPPYDETKKWIQKAIYERDTRNVKSLLLLPARTDTKWFHDHIYKKPNIEIRFLKGRLKFEGSKNSAPFPSMLVIVS